MDYISTDFDADSSSHFWFITLTDGGIDTGTHTEKSEETNEYLGPPAAWGNQWFGLLLGCVLSVDCAGCCFRSTVATMTYLTLQGARCRASLPPRRRRPKEAPPPALVGGMWAARRRGWSLLLRLTPLATPQISSRSAAYMYTVARIFATQTLVNSPLYDVTGVCLSIVVL